MICQLNIKRSHNIRVIRQPLKPSAIIAVVYSGRQGLATSVRRGTSVLWDAIRSIGVKLCHQRNSQVGEVELVIPKHIEGGKGKIPNEWLSLNHGDMLEKRGQKEAILLRNGKNYKSNTNIVVLFAISVKNLLETTLFRYQKMAQIILQTFSHYVAIAIAKSGNIRQDCFNIYENKELLEVK